MKKSTKSARARQPRRPRSSTKRVTCLREQVIDLREQVREGLLSEIPSAVAAVAHQLVEDEVLGLTS